MNVHVHDDPGDAAALVELARAVGSEPEGWLITNGEWRSHSEERRYLRSVRHRHSHAAVFVAETADDGIVGRISLARETHPASEARGRPGPDGGRAIPSPRRQARAHGCRRGLGAWGFLMHKLELHVFPYNAAAIALYEAWATSGRATAATTTGAPTATSACIEWRR